MSYDRFSTLDSGLCRQRGRSRDWLNRRISKFLPPFRFCLNPEFSAPFQGQGWAVSTPRYLSVHSHLSVPLLNGTNATMIRGEALAGRGTDIGGQWGSSIPRGGWTWRPREKHCSFWAASSGPTADSCRQEGGGATRPHLAVDQW